MIGKYLSVLEKNQFHQSLFIKNLYKKLRISSDNGIDFKFFSNFHPCNSNKAIKIHVLFIFWYAKYLEIKRTHNHYSLSNFHGNHFTQIESTQLECPILSVVDCCTWRGDFFIKYFGIRKLKSLFEFCMMGTAYGFDIGTLCENCCFGH